MSAPPASKHPASVHAEVRFYSELNDFLPLERRGQSIVIDVAPGTTVKDLVESLGVPHTEIEVILVGGKSVDFARRVCDGDRVSVYPVFESLDVSPILRLRPDPLREPRFVVDTHLGRLARHLRLVGFDTTWTNNATDDQLARASVTERRIILTKDRGLLKRRIITHGYFVRATSPQEQVVEVLRRFDLFGALAPFSRCLECNAKLEVAKKEHIEALVPQRISRRHEIFRRCPGCGRVYWRGSHYERLAALVEWIRSEGSSSCPS